MGERSELIASMLVGKTPDQIEKLFKGVERSLRYEADEAQDAILYMNLMMAVSYLLFDTWLMEQNIYWMRKRALYGAWNRGNP